MKCQKCGKQAVVHLTEVVGDGPPSASDPQGGARAVEIHLCMPHAIDAGLMIPSEQLPLPYPMSPISPNSPKKSKKVKQQAGAGAPSLPPENPLEEPKNAIIPFENPPMDLAVSPPAAPAPLAAPEMCPLCGLTWNGFKKAGLMGCGHDYETFQLKILPLIQRAQEGAGVHVGKVPSRRKGSPAERHIILLRLQHELQHAVESEKYEEAARLRDRLRQMDEA